MKKLLFVLLFCGAAFGQGSRYDSIVFGARGQTIPNAQITVCTATATGLPCSPQVLTYTDATLTTSCAAGFQVVLSNTSVCQATGDANGNFGFWLPAGSYKYTITGPSFQGGGQTFTITAPFGPGSNPTFGAVTAGSVNGVVDAASQAGATLDVQLNACLAAAKLTPTHVCDARRLGNGTIAAQVDVGDNATATPVELLLPPVATWTGAITNGTSCMFMVHDAGIMLGDPSGEGIHMTIQNGATGNIDSIVCTDPSPVGGGSYVRIGGFQARNTAGGTVVTAALNIQKTFDNALVERVVTVCFGCKGVYVHNVCCGLEMRNIQGDGESAANSLPCVVGQASVNTGDVHFTGHTTCAHPGSGKNALTFQGNSTFTQDITIDDLYMEPNQSDLTTALAQLSGNGPFAFLNVSAGNFAGSPTNYLIDIPGETNGFFLGTASMPVGGNAINDHAHGFTITGTVNQTVGPYGYGNIGSQFYLTKLTVDNKADATLINFISCGLTAAQNCELDLRDQGVTKYAIQKDSSNLFQIFNSAAGIANLQATAAGSAIVNAATGQLVQLRNNNSTVASVSGTGLSSATYQSNANCSSAASPAVCSAAPAGSVAIANPATTIQVNTTAVTANSQIFVQEDSSLGTKLGVTCNTTAGRTYQVTARSAATSFTITVSATPAANSACLSYFIVN